MRTRDIALYANWKISAREHAGYILYKLESAVVPISLHCEQHKKYVGFIMYAKETKDGRYRGNPFRSESFRIDLEGNMRYSNGKDFDSATRSGSKGTNMGSRRKFAGARTAAVVYIRRNARKHRETARYESIRE